MEINPTIKKKIMFSKGDDFYFLTYNILLILYGLDCICGKRTFKDYRKLAFMIDFVSNRNLANTIKNKGVIVNPIDRELFTRAYANGLLRLNQIIRLLFTLENQGLIKLEREQGKDVVNICLTDLALKNTFFDKELFKLELNNLNLLSTTIQRSSSLTLDTLLTKLFENHGIKTWAK